MPNPKTAIPSRPGISTLMYSLPVRRLREILNHVVPNATLGPVEELPSPQLARLYTLKMSNDQKLILSFAPSLAVRLLRQEATLISSEATLVYFIESSRRRPESASDGSNKKSTRLFEVVPKLNKHSSNNREMGYPYTIFEPIAGAPLSTLSIYLSLPERRIIDKQVGLLARSLASLTSPFESFGIVSRVLPDPFAPTASAPSSLSGSKTWSEGFNTILEGILRDGEDMAVILPYDVVRGHYRRLSYHLDAVLTPRLAILDVGSETNVMVERRSDGSTTTPPENNVRLTGLRSWSQGIFGDPLIATCFDEASEALLEGWAEGGPDIIDDKDNSAIRMLLYRCYRAVVMIVTEYYRPQPDSSRRELEGRRKLTSALAELEKTDVYVGDALKRVRSLSSNGEGSKRQKFSGA